jgi:hypothetical protein
MCSCHQYDPSCLFTFWYTKYSSFTTNKALLFLKLPVFSHSGTFLRTNGLLSSINLWATLMLMNVGNLFTDMTSKTANRIFHIKQCCKPTSLIESMTTTHKFIPNFDQNSNFNSKGPSKQYTGTARFSWQLRKKWRQDNWMSRISSCFIKSWFFFILLYELHISTRVLSLYFIIAQNWHLQLIQGPHQWLFRTHY